MGNQAKIEIVNDFVWFRKGDKMSALDVICKFCYVASKAISADPSKNIDEKQAKKKLMQLIFAGTGVLITDSGNISTRKNGGLEKNAKVKINRVLKMGSSDFDLAPDGENFTFISKLIPDIEFRNQQSTSDTVTFTIKGRDYPLQDLSTLQTINVTPASTFENTRARSRQAAMRISNSSSDYGWRLGDLRLEIRPDGKR